eukprot:gene12269-biopygen6457
MMAEDSQTQKTAVFCVRDPAFCVQIPAFCVQLRSRSAAFCVRDPAFCVQILRSAFTCVLRSAAFRMLRSAAFCVQLRSAFRILRSAFRSRVPGRKGASTQMGQAAEGAVRGTVFNLSHLAFLRLAKLDSNIHLIHLLFLRFEPPSSSRLRRLFPEAAGEWAAPRYAGGAARVQLRSAFRNLRSAFRILRYVGPTPPRETAFCISAFCNSAFREVDKGAIAVGRGEMRGARGGN